jgi:hypothetical protein
MAGYSGTPLPKKLGIKEESRLAFVDAPASFAAALGPLPAGVEFNPGRDLDLIVLFVRDLKALRARFGGEADRLQPAGMLWVGWPKKRSGVATDLDENVVRTVGLEEGLVDTKVCAIDEVWSGLKFVVRVKDRPAG